MQTFHLPSENSSGCTYVYDANHRWKCKNSFRHLDVYKGRLSIRFSEHLLHTITSNAECLDLEVISVCFTGEETGAQGGSASCLMPHSNEKVVTLTQLHLPPMPVIVPLHHSVFIFTLWFIYKGRDTGCPLTTSPVQKQRLLEHRFLQKLGWESSHEWEKVTIHICG